MEHLFASAYQASARATDSVKLEYVLRVRSELSAGRADLLALLDVPSLVQILRDPDAVAAYAETLAAEASIRRAAGEEPRATAIEQRALSIALELRKTLQYADAELDAFIDAVHARDGADAGPATSS